MPWNLIAVPERKPMSPRMRPSRTNPPKPKPPETEGYVQRWQR